MENISTNPGLQQHENQMTILMEMLKIPAEKRNFKELQERIQNLIEENAIIKMTLEVLKDSRNLQILESPNDQNS